MSDKSLYERLGGIYAIAAVVDHFSDQLLKNPKIVRANPELKEWHTDTYRERLPGLKFLRTLWTASVAGGPFKYAGKPLRDAHFELRITPEVFDEVILGGARALLGPLQVPAREKTETLEAFKAQKADVTAGAEVAEETEARAR